MAVVKNVLNGFLTTMKGMYVTGRELFKKPTTFFYPYEKREIPERFRGTLVNDVNICTACQRCVKVCPVDCIECKAEGKGKERHPVLFTIDYMKCCWCNLCVEACPEDSLSMTHEYEMVYTDRSKMIRDFVKDPFIFTEDPDYKTTVIEKSKEEEKAESGLSAA